MGNLLLLLIVYGRVYDCLEFIVNITVAVWKLLNKNLRDNFRRKIVHKATSHDTTS